MHLGHRFSLSKPSSSMAIRELVDGTFIAVLPNLVVLSAPTRRLVIEKARKWLENH